MPLRPAPSAFAGQTMKKAYDDLKKSLDPTHSRDFQSIDLANVRKAATELEEQLAARQSLRNLRRLAPLLDALERYSNAAESLCRGTPYLKLLWAPLTEILRASSDLTEALEKILKGYSELACSLQSFQLLGHAFRDNAIFQDTLAVIYANILEFHKHAYIYVHRAGWKLLFMSSWGRFGHRLSGILEDLRRHRELLESNAKAHDIFEARRMREDMRTWREEHLESLKQAEQERSAKDFLSITSALNIDEQDRLSIFHEVSSEGEKYPGTCAWVTSHPLIKSWLRRTPETPMLWLKGPPGWGKSIISARLVAFLRAANIPVIHHFCTYLFASSTKLDQILRSILLQLLRIDSEMVSHVYHLFVQQKKQPSISALEQLLLSLLEGMTKDAENAGHIWIILDGVDECAQEKMSTLLSLMKRITSKSSTWENVTVKVLISSHASYALTTGLRHCRSLSLGDETSSLHDAIHAYSTQRLGVVHTRLAQIGVTDADIAELADAVAARADGMFLYARLVLDHITAKIFFSPDEVKRSVADLPDKVTKFYQQILTRILNRLDAQSVDRIRCVLGWIAFAKRPLKLLELLSAVSFSAMGAAVDHLAPRYLLDECAPFVVERGDTTLAFIHASIKEFLEGPALGLTVRGQDVVLEHCRAATSCLISGMHVFSKEYQESVRNIRVVKGIHGFHLYATEHWLDDLLSIGTTPEPAVSRTLQLVHQLVLRLDETYGISAPSEAAQSRLVTVDKRLVALQQYPKLYHCALSALEAASLDKLESRILANSEPVAGDESPPGLGIKDGISKLLSSYQATTRYLLCQHAVEGVSADELKLFKEQFGSSAFTCRLRTCPHATLGFESESDREHHEMAHVRGVRCSVPGCQYLPFSSTIGLQKHIRERHETSSGRRTIRRAPRLQTQRNQGETGSSSRRPNVGEKTTINNTDHHASPQPPPGLAGPPPPPPPPWSQQPPFQQQYPQAPPGPGNFPAQPPQSTASPGPGKRGGIGRPPAGGPATPQINTPMPYLGPGQSPQVPNSTPDHPRVMQHPPHPPQPGNSLGDLDVERLPAHYKKPRDDWFVIFNPNVPRILDVDLLHTLQHESVVSCVRFSADGKYVATGCKRSAQIFDAATGEKICVLQDENIGDLYIRSVCFSPDGKYLATGAEDKLIRVWDIQSRQIRTQFSGHEQEIHSLDFARNGRTIASGSGDRTVRLWDIETGGSVLTLTLEDGVTSVAISPDTKYIAAGSIGKSVQVWDFQTGFLVERLEGPDGHKNSIYSVAFSPNGKDLVSGSLDKTIKMWELAIPRGMPIQGPKGVRCVTTLEGHRDFVLSVAFTPDAQWVISGSKDRGVQFWDPWTGSTQLMLWGHKNSVISVAPSPAGGYFATGSGDMRARIWSYNRLGHGV
ncbi:hypothetical protein RB595_005026 [Gaeumannomyces hyphopodioides]